MLKPQGYAVIFDPDQGNLERDTFTCCHCEYVYHLKPGIPPENQAHFCRTCYKLACPKPECVECVPFEKKLEQWEKIGNMILERGR